MKSICVFCGSKAGTNPAFTETAKALGLLLAQSDIGLVYGGGKVGLMGVIADAVLQNGGQVTGVIPEFLARLEVAHTGLSKLVRVSSMHERKMSMASEADAFIAMPGGIGTLEELFEVFTWAQLGLHAKPLGLLNVAGYYDLLLQFLEKTVSEKFLKASNLEFLQVDDSPERLLIKLENFPGPDQGTWVKRSLL